jgi:hypothetical protein
MAIHIKPSHKGLLHHDLGVPEGQPIPAKKLAAAKRSASPAVRKRATFAENAKSWSHGGEKPKHAPYSETHRYDWRQRQHLKRGNE